MLLFLGFSFHRSHSRSPCFSEGSQHRDVGGGGGKMETGAREEGEGKDEKMKKGERRMM